MTVTEFLAALHSDPSDVTSPTLIVGDGMLTPAQREQVVGSAYNRRAYAVVQGLPRGGPTTLHNRLARLTGGLQIHLLLPPTTTGFLQGGGALSQLQASVARMPLVVDEIASGYKLDGPLVLVTEIDPRSETFDAFDGLAATTRFQYNLWR